MTKVSEIEISRLSLLEHNPRKITREQLDNLCKSIKKDPEFLNLRPILVNHDTKTEQFVVYAGNQRVRAAKKLKMKTIPCIIEKDLSEETIRERIIKDNKTYGEFDIDMLANEWDTEILLECGFEAKDLAFYQENIIDMNEELDKPKKTKTCPSCGHEF